MRVCYWSKCVIDIDNYYKEYVHIRAQFCLCDASRNKLFISISQAMHGNASLVTDPYFAISRLRIDMPHG